MILSTSEILMFPAWIIEIFNSPCITLEEMNKVSCWIEPSGEIDLANEVTKIGVL